MIHRLHYKYLNSYLSVYFYRLPEQLSQKTEIKEKQKFESFEMVKIKEKALSVMA